MPIPLHFIFILVPLIFPLGAVKLERQGASKTLIHYARMRMRVRLFMYIHSCLYSRTTINRLKRSRVYTLYYSIYCSSSAPSLHNVYRRSCRYRCIYSWLDYAHLKFQYSKFQLQSIISFLTKSLTVGARSVGVAAPTIRVALDLIKLAIASIIVLTFQNRVWCTIAGISGCVRIIVGLFLQCSSRLRSCGHGENI